MSDQSSQPQSDDRFEGGHPSQAEGEAATESGGHQDPQTGDHPSQAEGEDTEG